MAATSRNGRSLMAKISARVPDLSLPEKYQGGRIEKYYNFWKNLILDYQTCCQDIVVSVKEKPYRSAFAGATALTSAYFIRNNPDDQCFRDEYLEFSNQIGLLPETLRNRESLASQLEVAKLYNSGLLQRWNCYLFSLIWRQDLPEHCDLPNSNVDFVRPTIYEILTERIVDVGVLGRWLTLEKNFKDFDVNLDEWNSDGSPREKESQLKHMW